MESNKTGKQNPYHHSKIDKLIDPESGYYYWASTTNRLTARLCQHKDKARQYPHRKVYEAFNEIGWEKVKILEEKKLR